jgi:hypothetical protein
MSRALDHAPRSRRGWAQFIRADIEVTAAPGDWASETNSRLASTAVLEGHGICAILKVHPIGCQQGYSPILLII